MYTRLTCPLLPAERLTGRRWARSPPWSPTPTGCPSPTRGTTRKPPATPPTQSKSHFIDGQHWFGPLLTAGLPELQALYTMWLAASAVSSVSYLLAEEASDAVGLPGVAPVSEGPKHEDRHLAHQALTVPLAVLA